MYSNYQAWFEHMLARDQERIDRALLQHEYVRTPHTATSF